MRLSNIAARLRLRCDGIGQGRVTVVRETELYQPVKAFLEQQGYVVRGEVGGCDLVAVRGDEPPIVVELKLRFSLELLLQGVDRLVLSDHVYLATPRPARASAAVSALDVRVRRMCARLGLGLILVDLARPPVFQVEVLLDPVPYRPRRDTKRTARLLREHARRVGDGNLGGSTRRKLMTAYRQDALRCARLLDAMGEVSLAELRRAGAPPGLSTILSRDVYGWFERVGRGRYLLTATGRSALVEFAEALELI